MEKLRNLQGDQEGFSRECSIPSESHSLAREGIFLALSKGVSVFLHRYTFQKGLPVASEYEPLQSPRCNRMSLSDAELMRGKSKQAVMRK
jgi:hypothetical protein